MTPPQQLFLSYNSCDRTAATALVEALGKHAVGAFFDHHHLVPGQPWPQALEAGLEACDGAAILIGAEGLGLWQKREMGYALDRQVRDERRDKPFPVIPVLLPGADPGTGFLFLNTWIDYRDAGNADTVAVSIARALAGKSGDKGSDRPAICPYQGLRSFTEENAAFFVGRAAETQRLFEAVRRNPMTVLVGASGSGKSSLVQAGLLPRLRGERPPADTWDSAVCRPGREPFRALAIALQTLLEPEQGVTDRLSHAAQLADALRQGDARLGEVAAQVVTASGGTDRLLIVVDQFEELFTQTSPELASPFARLLADAAEDGTASLVLTVRADYYGHVLALDEDFGRRLEGATVNLGPMTRAGLREAIVVPAQHMGLWFEGGLAEKILDDAGDEPGPLPLLQFALTELWARREGNRITFAAYEAIGRVAGAIARRADQVVASLDSDREQLVRGLFTRLVTLGDGESATRRRAELNEIEPAAHDVARQLADSRLLVIGRGDGESVELAHEAIIRHWDRLGRWLNEDREFLLWRQRLRLALDQWQRNARSDEATLRGLSLSEAERWLRDRPAELRNNEAEFITASRDVRDRFIAEQVRNRRLRLSALIAGLVVALTLGTLATVQWWHAKKQRERAERLAVRAEARQLAAESEARLVDRVDELERAILLGVESFRRYPGVDGERALRRALALRPHPLHAVEHYQRVTGVAFSPNGSYLATAGDDGVAAIVDVGTGEIVHSLSHLVTSGQFVVDEDGGFRGSVMGYKEEVRTLEFSPDSALLATGNANGVTHIWNVETGEAVLRIGHEDKVDAVAFSPDGTLFASGSHDSTVKLAALPGGEQVTVIHHNDEVRDAEFSPDGRWLATVATDGWLRIVDAATGEVQQQLGLRDAGLALDWSPDSTLVAAAGGASVHVFAPGTGERIASVEHRDFVGNRTLNAGSSYVFTLEFSPDSQYLLTGSRDGTARVWVATTGQEVTRIDQLYSILDVAFAPDGRSFVTGSYDDTARVWKTLTGRELLRASGYGSAHAVAFSPDGNYLATATDGGVATLWSTTGGSQAARLAHDEEIDAIAFAPGNEILITVDRSGTVRSWQFEHGKLQSSIGGGFPDPSYQARRLRFSEDGSRLFAWGRWPKLHVIDRANGLAHVRTVDGYSRLTAGTRYAATVDRDHSLALWSLDTGEQIGQLSRTDVTVPIGIRGDDGAVFAAHRDGVLRIYETPSLAETKSFSTDSRIERVALSRTGTFVAIDTPDGLLLYRGSQRRVLDGGGEFRALFFTPGEQTLVAVRGDQTIKAWSTSDGTERYTLTSDMSLSDFQLSPDGAVLAVAGDKRVQLIDVTTGATLARLYPETTVELVTFSPDGNWVATALRDESVTTWRWRTDELVPLACARLSRNLSLAEWRDHFPDQPYAKTCAALPADSEAR